jgi:hypothetical protein
MLCNLVNRGKTRLPADPSKLRRSTRTSQGISAIETVCHRPAKPSPSLVLIRLSPTKGNVMGASDELEYLKSLVSQLNEKIIALEAKAKTPASPKSPARQLRTVFIGPPGAGM